MIQTLNVASGVDDWHLLCHVVLPCLCLQGHGFCKVTGQWGGRVLVFLAFAGDFGPFLALLKGLWGFYLFLGLLSKSKFFRGLQGFLRCLLPGQSYLLQTEKQPLLREPKLSQLTEEFI